MRGKLYRKLLRNIENASRLMKDLDQYMDNDVGQADHQEVTAMAEDIIANLAIVVDLVKDEVVFEGEQDKPEQ